MPAQSTDSQSATSGIQTSQSGERLIPQSVRADGSIRKEIKIRPGYRPPEDIATYKNRTAESWKTRSSGPVPGADGFVTNNATSSEAKGKNAKRREARKKSKGTGIASMGADDAQVDNSDQFSLHNTQDHASSESKASPANLDSVHNSEQADTQLDKEKQIRNLKKKLRQAKDLQSKNESGQPLLPEQFSKVIKIQELMRQLDALELDGEATTKPQDP